MIKKISEKIFSILSDDGDSQEQKEVLLFGITRIVEDIPKYLGLIVICAVLGVFTEFMVVMAVTMLYKTFTGGVHLHTNIGCFVCAIVSTLTCIYLPQFLVKYNSILIPFCIITYIFSLYIIWVYVPADVPEIPIVNKNRRKRDKIMAIVILNLLFLIAFLIIKNELYIFTVMVTILNIDIMTTRTIYKIFKNQYGYEIYVPDELLMTD